MFGIARHGTIKRSGVCKISSLVESNDLIRWEQYEYDSAGNRSSVIRNISGQTSRETLRYDSMNRLIQKTDSIGATETTSYQDQYPNAYGQKVLQTIHTDPMGLETIETKDAQNHLVPELKSFQKIA